MEGLSVSTAECTEFEPFSISTTANGKISKVTYSYKYEDLVPCSCSSREGENKCIGSTIDPNNMDCVFYSVNNDTLTIYGEYRNVFTREISIILDDWTHTVVNDVSQIPENYKTFYKYVTLGGEFLDNEVMITYKDYDTGETVTKKFDLIIRRAWERDINNIKDLVRRSEA